MKSKTACTTLLVGRKMMSDNAMIVARSEDHDAVVAKNLKIYQDTDFGVESFKAKDSPFKCNLPKKALGYTALEGFDLIGHWGSAGYNSAKVGMSATESIFSSDKALEVDPMPEDGVGENGVFNIVLPYIKSAREGVERLGKLIKEHGVCEGIGVAFVDKDEIWYLETACGHRWLACRIPDETYFVTGNQSRFRDYDPKDKVNYIASEDLVDFAIEHNLYNPDDGVFDFHKAYIRDQKLDTTYNYPRVWGIQKMLSPSIKNDIQSNKFPVYAKADRKLTISDIREVFRFHYQGTEHDPYLHNNPKEPYRPISIFRTVQTHILQVRSDLPAEIGEINYVSMGMATLSVFIPFYQGMERYLEAYTIGDDSCSDTSAYWKFRKVQTLAMTNFNQYAPIVQKAYLNWEEETDQRQKEMELEYLKLIEKQPLKAKDLVQNFSDKIMQSAMNLADELANALITQMTKGIQDEYLFAGA